VFSFNIFSWNKIYFLLNKFIITALTSVMIWDTFQRRKVLIFFGKSSNPIIHSFVAFLVENESFQSWILNQEDMWKKKSFSWIISRLNNAVLMICLCLCGITFCRRTVFRGITNIFFSQLTNRGTHSVWTFFHKGYLQWFHLHWILYYSLLENLNNMFAS